MNTKQSRIRRARKTRAKIAAVKATRLAIHRTNSHVYAQIISADGGTVMVSASSNDKEMRAVFPGETMSRLQALRIGEPTVLDRRALDSWPALVTALVGQLGSDELPVLYAFPMLLAAVPGLGKR